MDKTQNLRTNQIVWKNDDNKVIYENSPPFYLKEYIITSGLVNNPDIEMIYNKHTKQTRSLLEIGAGYGRVLYELQKRGYKGYVSCIERNKKYHSLLRNSFSNYCNIFQYDFKAFVSKAKFDIILWLWSGFAEFSRAEQPSVFKKATELLPPGGKLIIDTVEISEKLSLQKASDFQNFHIYSGKHVNHRYFPTKEEFKEYAASNNVLFEDSLEYTKTSTGKRKTLHIFQKTGQEQTLG